MSKVPSGPANNRAIGSRGDRDGAQNGDRIREVGG